MDHQKVRIRAFTLIEILIVVSIIGMLTGISTVSYSQFIKKSRDARRTTDLEQIRAQLELYRSKNNSYPQTISFGGPFCDQSGCAPAGNTYMQKIPNDPMPPNAYYYNSSGSEYTLGAYLETEEIVCVSAPSCSNSGCTYCIGPLGEK